MRPLNQSLGLRKHLKGSFLIGGKIGYDAHCQSALRQCDFLVGHGICPFMEKSDIGPDIPQWYTSFAVLLIFAASLAGGIWAWAVTGSRQMPLTTVVFATAGGGVVGFLGTLIVLCALAPVVAHLSTKP